MGFLSKKGGLGRDDVGRVHRITRPVAVEEELEDLVEIISQAKKPLVIVGGGVKYSEAGETVENFCEEFHIPFGVLWLQ